MITELHSIRGVFGAQAGAGGSPELCEGEPVTEAKGCECHMNRDP